MTKRTLEVDLAVEHSLWLPPELWDYIHENAIPFAGPWKLRALLWWHLVARRFYKSWRSWERITRLLSLAMERLKRGYDRCGNADFLVSMCRIDRYLHTRKTVVILLTRYKPQLTLANTRFIDLFAPWNTDQQLTIRSVLLLSYPNLKDERAPNAPLKEHDRALLRLLVGMLRDHHGWRLTTTGLQAVTSANSIDAPLFLSVDPDWSKGHLK